MPTDPRGRRRTKRKTRLRQPGASLCSDVPGHQFFCLSICDQTSPGSSPEWASELSPHKIRSFETTPFDDLPCSARWFGRIRSDPSGPSRGAGARRQHVNPLALVHQYDLELPPAAGRGGGREGGGGRRFPPLAAKEPLRAPHATKCDPEGGKSDSKSKTASSLSFRC